MLKSATVKLKELKDKGIPVYLIAGSHDFSPSGKTMLDVLEQAGLFVNVAKGFDVDGKLKLNFTVDSKTGVKITGLLGKKGGFAFEERELKRWPLSQCRVQNIGWINSEGSFAVWSGDAEMVIPFADYVKMCMYEKKGKSGWETIKEYIGKLNKQNEK